MTIPASFIQELIARADVVEIVGRYVPLKKAGANFMGLCPFHGEKSPSFSVSPTKQFYHCFGCGVHGNAIGFLMEHGGMGFVEAVHDLAGQYGLQVPEDDASPEERARAAGQRQKQATLSDVLEKAGEAYRKQLRQSPGAIDYLKGRGVSGEVAKQFGIGYAPPGWRTLAGVFPDYDNPLLAESGLVIVGEEDADKRYDRFRDRVMFPIRNVKGECIGFGGRVLGDEKPKYLNSPETPVFSKGRELYGLFEARAALRDKGYALVTEGYMDVVALAQLGFPNAVATLGTACTPEHVQKLFRFTDSVVFSFDGDAAGRRAARKALDSALPFASDVRSVKFLFLPAEHDPDSFIREHGAEAFSRFVNEATPLSRFMIEAAREGCTWAAPKAVPTWLPTPSRCGAHCPKAPSSANCSVRSLNWCSSACRTSMHSGCRLRRRPPATRPSLFQKRRATKTTARPSATRRATARNAETGVTSVKAARAAGATAVPAVTLLPAARRAHAFGPPAGPMSRPGCCCRTCTNGNRCRTNCTACCAICPASTASSSPGSMANCMNTAYSLGRPCVKDCAANLSKRWPSAS